ncbi:hypothetical protein F8M41_013928 [Gigaspora margarita]|uniref:Uncharacterized protein n=1 Tax=Gigaspora margarita TaxID=4874 RepID=A0A8H4AS78_GIGMA|nr:hypothetical protein F8M41_013928 [Gigaspora margarita]
MPSIHYKNTTITLSNHYKNTITSPQECIQEYHQFTPIYYKNAIKVTTRTSSLYHKNVTTRTSSLYLLQYQISTRTPLLYFKNAIEISQECCRNTARMLLKHHKNAIKTLQECHQITARMPSFDYKNNVKLLQNTTTKSPRMPYNHKNQQSTRKI